MKRSALLFAAMLCGALSLSVHAADANKGEVLAKSNGCMACHAVTNRLVGPSYKDVAVKYRDDKDAEAKLMKKIKDGGAGVWGQIPMPPHPGTSDADLKTMVDWIMAIK